MLARPRHLVHRQIVGRQFSEEATVLRIAGSRDDHGEYSETETSTDILCATAPVNTVNNARVRMLMEGGVQLDSMRLFWTVEDLDPVVEGGGAGDIVVYPRAGVRWRVHDTKRWDEFSESVVVRIEAQ